MHDESLQKMNLQEWAQFLLFNIYSLWFTVFTINMGRFDCTDLQLDLAKKVLDSMKKQGCKADEEIYRKIIQACGRCGLKERVHDFFKKMRNQGIQPTAGTHGAYVKAVALGDEVPNRKNSSFSMAYDGLCNILNLETCVVMPCDRCPNCDYTLTQ